MRRHTRQIRIGNIQIGSRHPVAIQSMVKVKTSDTQATLRQIEGLARCGCEIVRLAVKDTDDARAIKLIRAKTKIPLVADIHFNWSLAIQAIDNGIDKIRLNPGNIFRKDEIRNVAGAAKSHNIPIRVGLNSGSVPAAEMVRSALRYIKTLERFGFYDIVVSLKASNAIETIVAYRKLAKVCDYPLHLGVTAAGPSYAAAIKSSIAIGCLLLEGIGDTIRVSLTDSPEQEVAAAKIILGALGQRHFGPEIISCPTCGRCEADVVRIVKELEKKLCHLPFATRHLPPKVAVMGCVVNGPGEAKEADIGIAFGKKEGVLFRKGKPIRKVPQSQCVEVLLKECFGKIH